MTRLTEKTGNLTGYEKESKYRQLYRPSNFHTKMECYSKLGQIEDIEEKLTKYTFYGKIYQYPNMIMPLRFIKIYHGQYSDLDIRIEFELENGLGNVFYNVFDFGKTWGLTKEELE